MVRFPLLEHDGWSHGSKDTRFDSLLLEMVDLVAERWGYIETERFGLTGYSGGAQVCPFPSQRTERPRPISIPAFIYPAPSEADRWCSSLIDSSTYIPIAFIPSALALQGLLPRLILACHGRSVSPISTANSHSASISAISNALRLSCSWVLRINGDLLRMMGVYRL